MELQHTERQLLLNGLNAYGQFVTRVKQDNPSVAKNGPRRRVRRMPDFGSPGQNADFDCIAPESLLGTLDRVQTKRRKQRFAAQLRDCIRRTLRSGAV